MGRSVPSIRSAPTLLTAVALVVLLGLAGSVLDAGAQTTPAVTPFPRPIMAFVGADRVAAAAAVDPALAVQSVAVAEGDGIGTDSRRVVTVGFATPVVLPGGAYRVSVEFGDPDGARTRASYTAADGVAIGATIETSTDGRRWAAAGATDATLDGDSLRITAPVGATDPGLGLWVEAQVGDDAAHRSQSPVFSLDALLGRNTAGALPAGTVGTPTTASPTVAEPLAIPGAPPTLTVDSHLTVTETEPVPATLGGQPVVNALDEITFMPGYTPDGTMSAVVQINRTTGAIRALSGTTGLPTDHTGDGAWIVQGLPAPPPVPSATAPSTVVLDLAATTQALDLPIDPDGLALGLRRKLTLADGTDVITSPTMATLVWYETASPTGPPETLAPTTTEDGAAPSGSSSRSTMALLVGAAAVALLVIGAVVLLVRRRRAAAIDRWLDDYSPAPDGSAPDGSATDGSATPDDSAPEQALVTDPGPGSDLVEPGLLAAAPALTPEPAELLTIDRAAVAAPDRPETLTIDAPSVATPSVVMAPTTIADDHDHPERDDGPQSDDPQSDDPQSDDPEHDDAAPVEVADHDDAGSGRSPADALAFLEAEVSALSERVDRIPDRRDGQPDHPDDPA